MEREVVRVSDKSNVDIILGTDAPLKRSSPDYYAATLANRALGESTLSSRLGLKVRESEGLTYDITSYFRAAGVAPAPHRGVPYEQVVAKSASTGGLS